MDSYAPVAQLDRAPGFEPGGRRFESVRARQNFCKPEYGRSQLIIWWPKFEPPTDNKTVRQLRASEVDRPQGDPKGEARAVTYMCLSRRSCRETPRECTESDASKQGSEFKNITFNDRVRDSPIQLFESRK
jgi:hypothetical protein